MLDLKETRSLRPTKESGKDLTEFFTPRNRLKHLTSLELCTFQEDCLTTTLSALKLLKLKTKNRRHFDSKICGYTTIPSFKWSNNIGNFQLRDMACTSYNRKSTKLRSCLSNGTGIHSGTSSLLFNRPNRKLLMWNKSLTGTPQRIMKGNQEITHPDRIRDSTASYFENLLSGHVTPPSSTEFPFRFSKILEVVGNNLCSIPLEEDIKEIVFIIDKESVVGPDRYSSAFHQACWEFIAGDICDAVRDFFSGTPMPRSFTATIIVLISKVDSPQTWNDFRPISLCNFTNKILSKLLYRKISQALPELISPSQSSFVPAEAFSKGLDFLFTPHPDMCCQTKCAVKPSHLLYAYDVIIFTNCKEVGLATLIQFLRSYENMSGQKINYAKSVIPGKKASLIAQRIKAITGFTMKALPINYFGAPLYKGNKRKSLYVDLIDKVRAKIAGWECCYLSYGGGLQLIKTVLASIPIYLLQVLNPPVGTLQKIEQLFAKFFCESTTEQRRIHWTK
ncbi:UNVERIFIED_CONTAM: hypothetical protein Slati_2446300 [Sesamum latifolium]|uniref:Reverse transcriptase domain-containing protein n=1 Tax=Sesamum latifolium TaxID=2727402 RepID=A0AAW2WD90_9LAMI